MGVIATFNYEVWAARYPELAKINSDLAAAYFAEASIYHRNDGGGPVNDVNVQLTLLNMLTAHIAKLNAAINGLVPSDLVGRIDQATEGSVSVHADMPMQPGSAAWFQQTKYGAAYWAATVGYRRARYRAHPTRVPPTIGGW